MEKVQFGLITCTSGRTITIWILLVMLATRITGEIIFRVDPLALLSATLRTYQKAGCDTDQISLTCPRGTSISIELAQYTKVDVNDGLTIEELCPSSTYNVSTSSSTSSSSSLSSSSSSSSTSSTSASSSSGSGSGSSSSSSSSSNSGSVIGSSSSSISSSLSPNGSTNGGSDTNATPSGNCMWPNALQYSLLQTVVEACQKKKHCKFSASPGTYGTGISGVGDSSGSTSTSMHHVNSDPCIRVRKFVEIAYKCRPYEFRSKVACENDVIQLECNPYSRIAVYSASFGRTEYESIQCPQPQGVKEETCLASYATETVMQICHGRRRCNLSADSSTFGSPCRPNSRMYLKVVYTCVPKQVLKDRYESISEPDEPEHFDGDTNDLYDEDQFYKESEAIPKLQGSLNQTSTSNMTTTTEPATSADPIVTQPKGSNLQDDQERLYFYLLIAGSVGVFICIVIVVGRVIIQKRRERNENQSSSPKGETTLPNGFNDSISEIDADIDLTTPVPVPSVSKNENYVTYAGATTNLYGSLGPSNVSHTSTTMLLPSNPLMCARQSPDVIGVTNTYIGQTPHASSAMGTIVPISSLAQYTTAPTYHAGYIMDPDGILRRPTSTQPIQQPPQPSETFHYDGTAPRTLSTGVAQSSQFYYG